MDNWTYFATYQTSISVVRALPQSFSELFIVGESSHYSAYHCNFLIPRIIIPNVASVDQSLGLIDYNTNTNTIDTSTNSGNQSILRIWSGGMMLIASDGITANSYNYDVYYR